ncbi:hypothetical protein BKA70DRAFT_1510057 [Coprinopsis sp. MPI-PUGE-AT-0042]|nr:hypothetical protein BKA70DRAFT_1510057 [Coprinopsis sp. MPI-PUGE-AT-0042]
MNSVDSQDVQYVILSDYGRTFAKSRYANTTLTYVDVGKSDSPCFALERVDKDLIRKGRAPFMVIAFAILATSTTTAVIDSIDNCNSLMSSGPFRADIIPVWRLAESRALSIVYRVVLGLSVAIGDGLMIWRCYVIWKDKKWVIIPPSLVMVAATVTGLMLANPNLSQKSSKILVVSSILLSVSVNVTVTALIIARLAQTRKLVGQAFPLRKPSPMYTHAIAVLIEAAAPLALFGTALSIVAIVMFFSPIALEQLVDWQVAQDVFSLLYYSFCALSPQMIIFRITTECSWKHAWDGGNGRSTVTLPVELDGYP